MCNFSARDRREAIPSWHGYDYQGRVAIVIALEILNEIKNTPDEITAYDLGIEDIEDFAIYYSGELKSVHQVKAKANSTIGGYNEALYMLAKGITGRKDVQAFLHTSVPLDSTDWETNLGRSLREYCTFTENELLAKLDDEEKLKEYIKSLQKGITKNNTIDKRINEEHKALLKKIQEIDGGLTHNDNLSIETVRPAIESYISDLGNENIICTENLSRIKLYSYNQSDFFLNTDKVDNAIENSILQYWGKEAEFKASNIVSYRINLQELITEHVRQRYSNPSSIKISLQSFSEVLASTLEIDGAMRLLIQKDKLSSFRQRYCLQECHEANDNCNECDLLKKTALLEALDYSDFRNACYALCPQTTDNIIQKNATELITEPGTWECMFPVLRNVKQEAELNHCRIVYDLEVHFYMLTALYFSRVREAHILKNLCINETVDEFFSSACKNSELGLIFREIDYMIISADYELLNTELEKHNRSIIQKGHLADWTPSYTKITGPKEVHLINKDIFLERYSEVYE